MNRRSPIVVERSRAAKIRELFIVSLGFLLLLSAVLAVGLGVLGTTDSFTPERNAIGTRVDASPTDQVAELPSRAEDSLGPPDTVVVSGPNGAVARQVATFTYSAFGVQASFECRLDGGDFSPCPIEGQQYTGLNEGIHTFEVRAVNSSGDLDTVPASRTWTVDTTSPDVNIRPRSGIYDGSVTVTIETSEPATVYFTRDGTVPTTASPRYSDPVTVDTSMTLRANAIDLAGNVSEVRTETFSLSSSFQDDFEDGDLSNWTISDGVAIVRDPQENQGFVAQAASAGKATANARKTLGSPTHKVYVQLQFMIVERGDNPMSIIRLRAQNNDQILSVYITTSGKLAYQTPTQETRTSSITIEEGVWHTLQVGVRTGEAGEDMAVWLDNLEVQQLTGSEALGDQPIGRVQIGESAAGRIYNLLLDDVIVDTSFIPSSAIIITEAQTSTPLSEAPGPTTPEPATSPMPATPSAED